MSGVQENPFSPEVHQAALAEFLDALLLGVRWKNGQLVLDYER